MPRMTKKELEQKVKELEKQLNTEVTKMDEIEQLETSTMVRIAELVAHCEKITGRDLKNSVKRAYPKFSEDALSSPTRLRTMVKELTNIGMSEPYNLNSKAQLADWVANQVKSNTEWDYWRR